ncbi:hypothetical protein AOQ84DRAFT_373270 [Glonium stellatum]|uniref:Uncharacterized protein n=1 Tax=Glonium stellatum TaxID=574774 RepID=A0A8E2F7Y2_9PEZI|nr:hypothetical protein AOQ84DRAFT_373270 [Glonium stellatum]
MDTIARPIPNLQMVVIESYGVDLTRDAALEKFCECFFTNHKDAGSKLSPYGVLGFSPEGTRFAALWMKSLAKHIVGNGSSALDEMNDLIYKHRETSRPAWFPRWPAAGSILLLTLANAFFWQPSQWDRRAGDEIAAGSILILLTIADMGSSNKTVSQSKDKIREFLNRLDPILVVMGRNDLNSEATQLEILESMTDMAAQVGDLTTSSSAVCRAFVQARNNAILSCIPTAFQTARSLLGMVSWYDSYKGLQNMVVQDKWLDKVRMTVGMLDHSPAGKAREAALSALMSTGWVRACGAVVAATPLVMTGIRAFNSHTEASKWDKVNVLFVESIRHATSTYIYVLIEHTKQSPIAISSPQTIDILFQALMEAGIRPANIDDRSPEAFAAVIHQKAQILTTWKDDIEKIVV